MSLFEDANLCALHARRVTVMVSEEAKFACISFSWREKFSGKLLAACAISVTDSVVAPPSPSPLPSPPSRWAEQSVAGRFSLGSVISCFQLVYIVCYEAVKN